MASFLYAGQSWALNADTEERSKAIEMRCYRKLLGILYTKEKGRG